MATTLEDRLNAALGMTAEEMDARARAYEADDVDFADGDEVRDGSPFDYVGTRRETFVVQAADFCGVMQAARMDGCSKSDVYRAAVREYLDRRGLAHA